MFVELAAAYFWLNFTANRAGIPVKANQAKSADWCKGMKRTWTVFLFFLLWQCPAFPQGHDTVLLTEIAANIGSYKNKTVTLRLRLKHVDGVFHKVVFYDRKNSDISFDVGTRAQRDRFGPAMLNLHEGVEYLVRFKVVDAGSLGDVIGELESFAPLFMGKLP